jgi:hypothetical protein
VEAANQSSAAPFLIEPKTCHMQAFGFLMPVPKKTQNLLFTFIDRYICFL